MRVKTEIKQEDFDSLLGWFSPDLEEAGRKYEKIRHGLINYFRFRGCSDPEHLADETINRVALKLSRRDFTDDFKIAAYFYAFAAKVNLEDHKKRSRFVSEVEKLGSFAVEDEQDAANNRRTVCMESCLAAHPAEEKMILLKYYGFEAGERSERRRLLAKEHEINLTNLQTKISRLKKILRECLRRCLNGEKM